MTHSSSFDSIMVEVSHERTSISISDGTDTDTYQFWGEFDLGENAENTDKESFSDIIVMDFKPNPSDEIILKKRPSWMGFKFKNWMNLIAYAIKKGVVIKRDMEEIHNYYIYNNPLIKKKVNNLF